MYKQLAKYVSQSVVGMIGISVYILADTFFISRCAGVDGLAVLNLALPVYGLMFAIGAMIGIGSATLFSLRRASRQNTDSFFFQSVLWSLLLSIPFILCGAATPGKILVMMGADPGLVELGIPYLRVVLCAAPLFMANYSFTAFVRNDEAPSVAMIASVFGSLFNILFDYILMFPVGLGFIGAAIATALSPLVTMLICSTHFLSKKNHIGVTGGLPQIGFLQSACRLGTPAFVGEIAAAVTTITFNTLLLSIAGNTGVAAYGVIANTALVMMAIFNGIAQGIQPLMSAHYGAGDQRTVRKILRAGLLLAFCVTILLLTGIYCKTDAIIGVFNSEGSEELLRYAHTGIRLYFLGFTFASINTVMVTYFAATDAAVPALIGSLFRGLVGIVLSAVLLSLLFGLKGIWLSFLVSETLCFCIIWGMYFVQRRKMQRWDKTE